MTMAKKRDFLDDIIDIQGNLDAVRNPLGGLANALTATPDEVKTWNPADYKERPRANVSSCIACLSRDEDSCQACRDVCPVDAIRVEEGGIEISDACRKCGLCVAACPTEAFVALQLSPKRLYDRIAGAASSHEECYVTCTRALGRLPEENEVVLPCLGAVTPEVWFAVLADYPNVSAYLPLGICDRCRTVTGELALSDAIAIGETLSEQPLGLAVDEGELDHAKRRSWERKEFVNKVAKAGTQVLGRANPGVSVAQMVVDRLQQHTQQINKLQDTLDRMCGTPSDSRRRSLTQGRQLVLATLQKHPELVEHFELPVPACDPTLCNACGDCVHACPVRAIDLDRRGRIKVEPAFCVGCGSCVVACDQEALELVDGDVTELLVPDEEAERRAKAEAKQRAEVERIKEQGKKTLDKGLEVLEGLSDQKE
jgi:Fe-S-cluster-containing hydrogenase component 2